jgi:hypothetical protein
VSILPFTRATLNFSVSRATITAARQDTIVSASTVHVHLPQ